MLMDLEVSRWNRRKSLFRYSKFEELSDLKNFPEYFRRPLTTLWRATCGPQAASCPPLFYGLRRNYCLKLSPSRLFRCLSLPAACER